MPGSERRRRGRAGRWRLAVLGLLAMGVLHTPLSAQPARPVVYVVPIAGMIDLGLAPFVQRVLDEAAGADAAAVILEINTFGERVDAAVLIRDALLRARVRTVAFVNKRAISAGTGATWEVIPRDGWCCRYCWRWRRITSPSMS